MARVTIRALYSMENRNLEDRIEMNHADQRSLIVDQFTRMAKPFAELPAHSTDDSIRLVREAAGISASDEVLDVACGPGLLACAFAADARHVTGIDLTPAMIEQAEALAKTRGLTNVTWQVGDVATLPYPDGVFSVAFTRYSFHHLLDPAGVLAEMVRVARPGGRVVVVDVYTTSPEQAQAYDDVEILRDPSHVRALRFEELEALFRGASLQTVTTTSYKLDVGLDEILRASFTSPAAAATIRQILTDDLGRNRVGVDARLVNGQIHFSFPTVVLVGHKPG
jgi:ubiquinone/menaquinone biosynthesis C-methylase UbiE